MLVAYTLNTVLSFWRIDPPIERKRERKSGYERVKEKGKGREEKERWQGEKEREKQERQRDREISLA